MAFDRERGKFEKLNQAFAEGTITNELPEKKNLISQHMQILHAYAHHYLQMGTYSIMLRPITEKISLKSNRFQNSKFFQRMLILKHVPS